MNIFSVVKTLFNMRLFRAFNIAEINEKVFLQTILE